MDPVLAPSQLIAMMIDVSSSQDPYSTLADKLNGPRKMDMYPHILQLLIVFGVVYGCIFVFSATMIAIPFFRSFKHPHHRLWLWRKHFVADVKTPYCVPNGAMAFLISQVFGSLLFEVYAVASYSSLRQYDPRRISNEFFWLTISYAPGFIGFWFYGFGAFYISLFAPIHSTDNHLRSLPQPMAMNLACIGAPILITLIMTAWAIGSLVTNYTEHIRFDHLQLTLEGYSASWRLSRNTDPKLIETLLKPLELYYESVAGLLQLTRWATITWTLFGLVLLLVYMTATRNFLGLVKRTVAVSNGNAVLDFQTGEGDFKVSSEYRKKSTSQAGRESFSQSSPTSPFSSPQCTRNPRLLKTLEKNYKFLSWHCGTIVVLLVWYFVAGIIMAVKSDEVVTQRDWRAFSVFLTVLSAWLLSVTLLMQSWRTLGYGFKSDELHHQRA